VKIVDRGAWSPFRVVDSTAASLTMAALAVAIGAVAVMFVNLNVSAFGRWVSVGGLHWVTELAQLALVITVLLAAPTAVIEERMVGFTITLRPQWDRWLTRTRYVVVIGLLIVIFIATVQSTASSWIERTPALGVQVFWFKVWLPVGVLLMLVSYAASFVRELTGLQDEPGPLSTEHVPLRGE